jgi:hypothetical protein
MPVPQKKKPERRKERKKEGRKERKKKYHEKQVIPRSKHRHNTRH